MNDDQTIHATPAAKPLRPTDLRDLLEAQDRDFVKAAYRLLLGRDADPGGLQFYLSRIRSGARKLQILQEMSTSDEALASGIKLKGLRSALRWQKLNSVPLLGDLLRLCFDGEGDSPAEVRSRILEHQPYVLDDALAAINKRQDRVEAQLPLLQQTLADLNHRLLVIETEHIPSEMNRFLELNHRVFVIETEQLPSLMQRFLELNHRQVTFETQQLPTLLQTISELNHRQLSSDNARDNLVKSVPVALRNITRDIIEVRAHQDNISTATEQKLVETREQINSAKDLIAQRVDLLQHQLESTLGTLRQRIIEVQERFDSNLALNEQRIALTRDQCEHLAAASTMTEQRFGETREQIESATHLMDRRIIEIRDQIGTALHDVGYLFGRVEFIRRELMFEMRYGASAPPGGLDQLHVESKVLSPDKVDAARKFGIRLNLGCGHVALEGYINVDRRALPGVDIVAEVDDLPFTAGQVAEIFSAHLIEHFPQEQLRRTLLRYWRDLLRPGGIFRVVAPDAEGMMQAYYRGEYPFERLREVTFGGQDYNGDFHYNMLNTKSLTELLLAAGFVDVNVIAENRENGGCKEFEIAARRPEAE